MSSDSRKKAAGQLACRKASLSVYAVSPAPLRARNAWMRGSRIRPSRMTTAFSMASVSRPSSTRSTIGASRRLKVRLTVMGNINAIAVATLTDVACIVLAENAALDKEAAQRAELQGIPVYSCAENLYDTAVRVYETLK